MNDFNIFIENSDFRSDVLNNNKIPSEELDKAQEEARAGFDEGIYDLVSAGFRSVEGAAKLLSANGLFLQYAGPAIKNNYQLVKIAVNQNGDAIKYAAPELLMSDPAIAADLILSATVGHPCEAFREVVTDPSYIYLVSKKIVEMDKDMLNWVCGHMYSKDGYEVVQKMMIELGSFGRK